jgi:hypothetical protein
MSKQTVEKFKPGVYKHFKGNLYLALTTGKHTETLEEYVVYISLYENETSQVWIRPIDNFLGYKEFKDGTKVKRFEFVRER